MRVRIEVRWIEASYTAEVQPPGTDLGCSTVVFDAFADSWGVGRRPNGWVHWMVVDID